MAEGKGTALADIASDLGPAMALTGADPKSGDLFAALDEEVGLFDASSVAPPRRGRGRPAGSVNRTTLKLQSYLQSRGYRDPAEFLAALVTADPRDLAARLSGQREATLVTFDQALEVLKVQRAAAGELMPYFQQKMPIAVQHSGDGAARPLIIIGDGPRSVGAAGSAMSVYDHEENQASPAGRDGGSHE